MRSLLALGALLMALDVNVQSFNITTGAPTSTIPITVGFEAQCGILFWSGRSSASDGNGAGTHLRGMGVFSKYVGVITLAAVAGRSANAVGNAIADSSWRTDACILEQGDGAMVGWANISAISSTQVTFQIVDAFTTDLRVTLIAFGGSDITGSEVGVFQAAGTAPVDQTVTIANGTDPSLVCILGYGSTAAAPDTAIDSQVVFGVANRAAESYAWAGVSNDGSANMVTESYLRDGDVIATFAAAVGSVNNRATIVSVGGATGNFVINWATRNTVARFAYLAIAGSFQSKIGSFLTQTDTTTDMTGTTSFTPKGMVFLSHNKAQNSAGGLSAHDKWSMGAATGTSAQHCQAVADRDANTSSFVSMAVEQDHIYVNMDEVNRTLQGSANLTAVSATGFTARMTDADPAQASVCWLALGDASGATSSGALNLAPLTLSATANRIVSASGALALAPSVLAASAAISRTSSGALTLPPLTLAANAGVLALASGALSVPVTVLSADAEVERSASVALTLAPLTLAASLGVERTVAGTLTVTGPVLAASATIARTASGALIVPATTLAADVMRTVSSSGALTLPPPVLAAAVSVVRFADGTLALAVPVLAANVIGEELSVNAALIVPPLVLDADALITRTASGALTLAAPVLSATADRTVAVQGVLILEAPSLEAQAAIERFVAGDLELPALILAAQSFAGAIQSVIGLRASVTAGDRMDATVTAVRDSSTVTAAQKRSTVH